MEEEEVGPISDNNRVDNSQEIPLKALTSSSLTINRAIDSKVAPVK
jgi:hypothetical protein